MDVTFAVQTVDLTIGLVLMALVFSAVESLWPSIPGQRRLRNGLGIDLAYWFFNPLVTRSVSLLLVMIALAPFFLLLGHRIEPEEIRRAVQSGYGPVCRWPLWLQSVFVLVGGDLIAYWSHRLFHGRRLWRFHAIHHSSKEMDWLSSVRQHPINDLGTRLCQVVPFVLLGVSSSVVAVYIPFLILNGFMVHANLPWTFGPLRYIFVSPAFHRWHHSRDAAAIDKNFGDVLSVFDLLFGTYYMPTDRQPANFGVHGDSPPESFLGHMLYPFERLPRNEERTAAGVQPPCLSECLSSSSMD
jgi:sterol desaturase/sphingolipid hydroxylase (fatty acid hydroxylase superfamily)